MKKLIFGVTIHELPPSDNHLYLNIRGRRGGKRILSKEGESYVNSIRDKIKLAWEKAGMPGINRDEMLEIEETVRIAHVFCHSRQAENRFVKVDARNRGKLIEDAFHAFLGLDDSQQFHVSYDKLEGKPAIHLALYANDELKPWPGDEEETSGTSES